MQDLGQGVGVVSPETLKGVSGLDFMRGLAEGRYPRPPIAMLMGFEGMEVEHGRVAVFATPGMEHYNPIGIVHGGYGASLLDTCMGCAVHSSLPAGTGYTTLEFKIHYIRAMTVDTGQVRAEGAVLSSGRRAATAEGKIFDRSGKLLAHGTTTCLVFPL